jgi:hypothetical protein
LNLLPIHGGGTFGASGTVTTQSGLDITTVFADITSAINTIVTLERDFDLRDYISGGDHGGDQTMLPGMYMTSESDNFLFSGNWTLDGQVHE